MPASEDGTYTDSFEDCSWTFEQKYKSSERFSSCCRQTKECGKLHWQAPFALQSA